MFNHCRLSQHAVTEPEPEVHNPIQHEEAALNKLLISETHISLYSLLTSTHSQAG